MKKYATVTIHGKVLMISAELQSEALLMEFIPDVSAYVGSLSIPEDKVVEMSEYLMSELTRTFQKYIGNAKIVNEDYIDRLLQDLELTTLRWAESVLLIPSTMPLALPGA